MADIFRQTASETPPSLNDLIAIYPRGGLTPGAAEGDMAAITKAIQNPPEITTLQALAQAVRPLAATTVSAGLVELATLIEAQEGTDNQRAVTPAGLRAAIGVDTTPRAFIDLNDTPSALGTAGQYIRVNDAVDSLEFVDQPLPTGAEIVDALTSLSATARLPASAVRDLPAGTLAGLTDTPSSIGGEGQVLVVNNTRTGFVYANQSNPQSGLSRVIADSTLSGDGTPGTPLGVAEPYTAAERTKLSRIEDGAEVNVRADWNATSGDASILNKPTIPTRLTAAGIRNSLEGLRGNDRLPASAIRGLTTGITTFTGLTDTPDSLGGTAGQLIGVNSLENALEFVPAPNSITTSERNKLTAIEPNATADQTGAEIVSLLAALSGNARLPATAVRDLPAGNFLGLTDTPSSFGTAGNLVRVNSASNALEFTSPPNSITTSERNKLAAIEDNATADQTGAEIVSLLDALSGNARLPATAVRDLPAGNFLGLTDTPTSFTDEGGKYLTVNAGGTAVEFIDLPEESVPDPSKFRGAWSAATNDYAIGDEVSHNNRHYVRLLAGGNEEPVATGAFRRTAVGQEYRVEGSVEMVLDTNVSSNARSFRDDVDGDDNDVGNLTPEYLQAAHSDDGEGIIRVSVDRVASPIVVTIVMSGYRDRDFRTAFILGTTRLETAAGTTQFNSATYTPASDSTTWTWNVTSLPITWSDSAQNFDQIYKDPDTMQLVWKEIDFITSYREIPDGEIGDTISYGANGELESRPPADMTVETLPQPDNLPTGTLRFARNRGRVDGYFTQAGWNEVVDIREGDSDVSLTVGRASAAYDATIRGAAFTKPAIGRGGFGSFQANGFGNVIAVEWSTTATGFFEVQIRQNVFDGAPPDNIYIRAFIKTARVSSNQAITEVTIPAAQQVLSLQESFFQFPISADDNPMNRILRYRWSGTTEGFSRRYAIDSSLRLQLFTDTARTQHVQIYPRKFWLSRAESSGVILPRVRGGQNLPDIAGVFSGTMAIEADTGIVRVAKPSTTIPSTPEYHVDVRTVGGNFGLPGSAYVNGGGRTGGIVDNYNNFVVSIEWKRNPAGGGIYEIYLRDDILSGIELPDEFVLQTALYGDSSPRTIAVTRRSGHQVTGGHVAHLYSANTTDWRDGSVTSTSDITRVTFNTRVSPGSDTLVLFRINNFPSSITPQFWDRIATHSYTLIHEETPGAESVTINNFNITLYFGVVVQVLSGGNEDFPTLYSVVTGGRESDMSGNSILQATFDDEGVVQSRAYYINWSLDVTRTRTTIAINTDASNVFNDDVIRRVFI